MDRDRVLVPHLPLVKKILLLNVPMRVPPQPSLPLTKFCSSVGSNGAKIDQVCRKHYQQLQTWSYYRPMSDKKCLLFKIERVDTFFYNLIFSSFELLPLILSEISKHTHTHSLTPHVCDVSLSQVSTMRVQHVNIRVH